MSTRYTLGVVDYVVILIFLLVSAGIGVMFRVSGGKQQTAKEYLLAGRNMPLFPVILSTTATLTATGTMLGIPAEVYRYGLQFIVYPFATAFGMFLAVYVFVPVYFQCGVSTVYEFLEIRYGKWTRYLMSALFFFQTLVGMSPLLYGPSLALSAVTDLSLKMCILVIGGVCTFYCAVGGLKAVLWTDVLQAILMFVFVAAFYSGGMSDAGGISTIYETAKSGDRLNIFNFSLDFTVRYTFWNCFLCGFKNGFGTYGTSQLEVQRLLSIGDTKKAQRSLMLSIIPVFVFHCLSNLSGLVLYSIYHLCDPILNEEETGLTKYDQMIVYYIISKFNAYPGLTGLCIAGIFSGSLSSFSSILNCLSTVTVVDFVQPLFSKMTERKNVVLAKGVSVLYGLIGIGLAFAFSYVKSLKQFGVTLYVLEGSVVPVLLFGILSRKVDEKCVLLGVLSSTPIIMWMAMGSLLSGYLEPPLELSTNNCTSSTQDMAVNWRNITTECSICNSTDYLNATNFSSMETNDTFVLYKISYLWLPVLSSTFAAVMIWLMVFITGGSKNPIPEDSRCLSPVTQIWNRKKAVRSTPLVPVSDYNSQTTISTEEKNCEVEDKVQSCYQPS